MIEKMYQSTILKSQNVTPTKLDCVFNHASLMLIYDIFNSRSIMPPQRWNSRDEQKAESHLFQLATTL